MALSGCIINFFDIDPVEKKKLSQLVKENGGTVSMILGNQLTHIVTTKEAILKSGFKLQNAKKAKIQIVLSDFIHKKIAEYVPPAVEHSQEQQKQGTLTVFKSTTNVGSDVPQIVGVLPQSGKVGGTLKVTVMGNNFKPSTDMRLKFGEYVCSEIEYHCPTVVIATLYLGSALPGQVQVVASNNAGKNYGTGVSFTFEENEDSVEPWHLSEMKTLRNKIMQLQSDLLSVQRIEFELSNRFESELRVSSISRPPKIEHVSARPAIQAPKPVAQIAAQAAEIVKKKKQQVISTQSDDMSTREVRIFISSPFKDMSEERDIIVKHVIPKLRKLCSERDIVLTCVDLRWGVTSAQTQGAATLLMCLREIEKCNVFIGLYGERYGWCMSENSYSKPSGQDELLTRTLSLASKEFSWINQYKDRSVTEIEMRSILSNHTNNPKAAWFFMRDPYYIENVSSDKKQDYISEGEYEYKKLTALKNDILNSKYPSQQYLRPSLLQESILNELTDYLNASYPKGNQLSPFQRERFLHSNFSRSLLRVYLPNEKYFMELDLHASSNVNTPLVVIGESGIGKSAVLANWSKRYKSHHPEVLVIEHWIGSTPTSTEYSQILRRIMDEIQLLLDDHTEDIPNDPRELEKIFPTWLEKTLSRNKVNKIVLILDGLDALDPNNNSHTLLWFPRHFPATTRIFLSASPSRPLDMLRKRAYPILEIVSLKKEERVSFIRQYLDMNSKKLSESQEMEIASFEQTKNPRYLKTLLEDIAMWGNYDDLDNRIRYDLRAKDSSELYEVVLERLEKDIDRDKLENFMSYLWCSRRGLFLDTELGFILENEHGVEANTFQSIYLAVEELLLSSGGLLNFANKDIRKAVEHRYLSTTPETKKIFHSRLAEFFERNIEGVRDRKVDELAWQLYNAEDWPLLQQCITNLSMFNKLYSGQNKLDLSKYWRALESKYDVVECYINAMDRGDTLPAEVLKGDLYYQLARFLKDFAKYDGAVKVFNKARNVYSNGSQNLEVAKTDYAIGSVLLLQARYGPAEEIFQKCLKIYTRERGEDDILVASVLTKLGNLYVQTNSFTKADPCFKKALQIRKSKFGNSNWKVAMTLQYMIEFYERMASFKDAVDCAQQALKIVEEEFGPDDTSLTSILVSFGRVYMAQKEFVKAKQLYKRALRIAEEKLGTDHPRTAEIVYELGCFYFIKPEEIKARGTDAAEKFKNKDFWANRDYSKVEFIQKENDVEEKGWSLDKSEKMFLRALQIYENTLGKDHPAYARVLNRLGSLYIERVEFCQAEDYLQRALEITIKSFGRLHSRVAQTYKHMFTLYELQEKYEQAKDIADKAIDIISNLNGPNSPQIPVFLERLGLQAQAINNLKEAKAHFEAARALKVSLLGEKHSEVLAIDTLLQSLKAPPPPPPPPKLLPTQEELQSDCVEVTSEMKKQRGREDLLEAIRNFSSLKEKLHKHDNRARKAKNEEVKKGWWKQNYRAGFDAEDVKKKKK